MHDVALLDDADFEGRGIYLARWKTRDGCRVVYCVDSHGTKLRHVALRGTVTLEAAIEVLTATLDRDDPVPQLRLVRADAPVVRRERVPTAAVLALHGLIRRQSPPRA